MRLSLIQQLDSCNNISRLFLNNCRIYYRLFELLKVSVLSYKEGNGLKAVNRQTKETGQGGHVWAGTQNFGIKGQHCFHNIIVFFTSNAGHNDFVFIHLYAHWAFNDSTPLLGSTSYHWTK